MSHHECLSENDLNNLIRLADKQSCQLSDNEQTLLTKDRKLTLNVDRIKYVKKIINTLIALIIAIMIISFILYKSLAPVV